MVVLISRFAERLFFFFNRFLHRSPPVVPSRPAHNTACSRRIPDMDSVGTDSPFLRPLSASPVNFIANQDRAQYTAGQPCQADGSVQAQLPE